MANDRYRPILAWAKILEKVIANVTPDIAKECADFCLAAIQFNVGSMQSDREKTLVPKFAKALEYVKSVKSGNVQSIMNRPAKDNYEQLLTWTKILDEISQNLELEILPHCTGFCAAIINASIVKMTNDREKEFAQKFHEVIEKIESYNPYVTYPVINDHVQDIIEKAEPPIPKIIHYCWLSNDPIPEKLQQCMKSWREKLPDYEFMLWNFDRFDINSSPWVKQAFDNKKYAFAADYIRFYAVYNYGGIYLDMDVEVVKSFNDLLFTDCMIAREDYNKRIRLEGGCFGAVKGHPFIKQCLEFYRNRNFNPDRMDMYQIPDMMGAVLAARFNDTITVFTPDYFTAKSFLTGIIANTDNTHAIHHFTGTWLPIEATLRNQERWKYYQSVTSQKESVCRNRSIAILDDPRHEQFDIITRKLYYISQVQHIYNLSDDAYEKAARIYEAFTPKSIAGVGKIRIGGQGDGGYVMPDLDYSNRKDKIAYSFGVSNYSPWDTQMANMGYDVFQYDGTIDAPPERHPCLHFYRNNISAKLNPPQNERNIRQIISEHGHWNKSIILQCDIEGAEWEVFAAMNDEEFNQFEQIIVEFHNLADLNKFDYHLSILEKINRTYQPVHVHCNNWGGSLILKGLRLLPDVWEITYVRKTDWQFIDCVETFPGRYDKPNNYHYSDIFLGKFSDETNEEESTAERIYMGESEIITGTGLPPESQLKTQQRWKYYSNVRQEMLDKVASQMSNSNEFLRLWEEKHKKNNAVVVIGDSHCNFFGGNENLSFRTINSLFSPGEVIDFCADRLENFCTLHLGPALAYNLNRKGTQTAAREKVEKLLDLKILNENARIMCCFGEIDIRVNVLKQSERLKIPLKEAVDQIINNYIEFLLFLKNQKFNIFAWGAIPSQIDGSPINPQYPYYGSEIDRNIATELFNERLETCCNANGIGFVSIFKYLINDNYTTKMEFISNDYCHLSQKAWIFAKPELEKHFLM